MTGQPKVYLMCGKICSGKSTHAAALRIQHHAAVLSVDEITLALSARMSAKCMIPMSSAQSSISTKNRWS